MSVKLRKATGPERESYDGLYPLYGFATIEDQEIVIQDLRDDWKKPNPLYEAIAPDGFHFDEGPHTLCCFDLKDVRDRLDGAELEKCEAGCECELAYMARG